MPTNVKSQIITADQLFLQPSDGYRYELMKGSLVMMSPAGGRHGRVANRIAWLLSNHVEASQLGEVFAAETGFLVETNPDTVLAGDVAFVTKVRLQKIADETRFLPLAPDLVVEVISPSDTFSRVEAKAMLWVDCGCRLVLIVDPDSETVHAYWSRERIQVYHQDETLDASDAVDSWSVTVADFFAQLEELDLAAGEDAGGWLSHRTSLWPTAWAKDRPRVSRPVAQIAFVCVTALSTVEHD